MSIAEELWQWISAPLEELKRDFTAEPEKPWETRRDEFLRQLGVQDPSQHPVTEQVFKQLDEMTDEERGHQVGSGQFDSAVHEIVARHADSQQAGSGQEQAHLAGQGHEAGDGQAAAAGQSYDEHAWQDYLARSGTQWDGTQESWEPFAQWFLYYAGESGVQAPATALIDYLTPLSAAERITELARYGVTIAPAAQEPAASPASDAPVQQETPVVTDEQVASIMDDLVAADPAFADIPEERRMEIMNEVLSELQARAN